jgi:hypothetical protein
MKNEKLKKKKFFFSNYYHLKFNRRSIGLEQEAILLAFQRQAGIIPSNGESSPPIVQQSTPLPSHQIPLIPHHHHQQQLSQQQQQQQQQQQNQQQNLQNQSLQSQSLHTPVFGSSEDITQSNFNFNFNFNYQQKQENAMPLRVLKGIFNVDTTSTKDPSSVAQEIAKVLTENNINYVITPPLVFECSTQTETGKIRWEMEVCYVQNLLLTGVIMKRRAGKTWNYKQMCQSLIAKMQL